MPLVSGRFVCMRHVCVCVASQLSKHVALDDPTLWQRSVVDQKTKGQTKALTPDGQTREYNGPLSLTRNDAVPAVRACAWLQWVLAVLALAAVRAPDAMCPGCGCLSLVCPFASRPAGTPAALALSLPPSLPHQSAHSVSLILPPLPRLSLPIIASSSNPHTHYPLTTLLRIQ